MANPFLTARPRTMMGSNPFLVGRGADDLKDRAQELELLQRQFDAPEIEQDKPGFFARTVDVLSGWNYAIAGFSDELLQGKGLGTALGRFTREFYSSARSLPLGQLLPEVEAQKETFGKVLQDAGMGTVSLADVLPFTEGTFLGKLINTRGTLGVALDIVSDPLTYFSFGQSAIARKLLLSGPKNFSRAGNKLFGSELKLLREEMKKSGGQVEDVTRLLFEGGGEATRSNVSVAKRFGVQSTEGILEDAQEDVLREVAFRRAIAKHGEKAIVDQGGIKWMGKTVTDSATLKAIRSKFSRPLLSTVRRFEFGDNVLNAAERIYSGKGGLRDKVIGIFSKNERLAGLPDATRRVVVDMARKYRKGGTELMTRLAIKSTGSDWWKHLKANPERLRPVVDAIERGAIDTLEEADQLAAKGMAEFFDELGEEAVELGIITAEQYKKGRYFPHMWANNPEEFTEVWARWTGDMAASRVAGKHNVERVHETMQRGETISAHLNNVADAARRAGIPIAKSPDLVRATLEDTMMGYLHWHTAAKSRILFAEDAAAVFGTKLGDLTADNIGKIFDGMTPRNLPSKVAEKIEKFLDDNQVTPFKKGRGKRKSDYVEAPEVQVDPLTGRPKRSTPEIRVIKSPSDRPAIAKAVAGLGAEQRASIAQGLRRLVIEGKIDDPVAKALERKISGAQALSDWELLKAQDIVHKNRHIRAQGRKVLSDADLDIYATRTVSDEEAVGRAIGDADLGDIMGAERQALDQNLNYKSRLNPMTAVERGFLKSLDGEGRREYLRRVLEQMVDEGNDHGVVDFLAKYNDEFAKDMPRLRTLDGTSEDILKRFDEVATEKIIDPITGKVKKQSDYVLRGGNALWGEDVKFIPRLIADYIDKADPRILKSKDFAALRAALTPLDFTNNWFKMGVYPMFPASAIRDAYSNVWYNSFRIGLHALDPRLFAQSIKVLAHLDDAPGTVKAMSRAMTALGYDPQHIITKSGRRLKVDEVARQLSARHVTITAEEGLEISADFAAKRSVPRRVIGKVLKEAREPIDNTSRVSLAVQNLIDDLSFDDAAHEVGEYLFHYNEIPAFAREFITRAVPFARFTLKNTEFHYKMLRRDPGAVINRLKPFRGREDENQHMVSFRAEGLKIRLDRDGRTLHAVTGIDLPTRNLDLYWRGSTSRTLRMAGGMLGPLLKAPIEVATQTDAFTGSTSKRTRAELVGRFLDSSNAPKSLKDWLGYQKTIDEAGRPRYDVDRWNLGVVFMKSWMFSRVMTTSDRAFRTYADKGTAPVLLDVLTGLRLEEINLDAEQEQLLKRRIRELEVSLERRGPFRRFSRGFQPKERPDRQTVFR